MSTKYVIYAANGDVLQSGLATSAAQLAALETALNGTALTGDWETLPDPDQYEVSNDAVQERAGWPAILTLRAWANLRHLRDDLLTQSDHTQIPDWPGDSAVWATYRQALRDLPANTNDIDNVTWPTRPDE